MERFRTATLFLQHRASVHPSARVWESTAGSFGLTLRAVAHEALAAKVLRSSTWFAIITSPDMCSEVIRRRQPQPTARSIKADSESKG